MNGTLVIRDNVMTMSLEVGKGNLFDLYKICLSIF